MNTANACKRFRKCAISLKFRFRSVAIERTHHRYSRTDVISARNAPVFLNHFGHLVESIEWQIVGRQQDELFTLLTKYCGETLKKLKVSNYNPHLNRRNQFAALEQLILYNAEPIDFCLDLDSPLKHLEIHNYQLSEGVDLEPWFVRDFPHLESVRLNSTIVTDESLDEFLSLNPQLRALEVDSEHITPMIFQSIGDYSKNLERLQIKSFEFHEYDSSELHEELSQLSDLRKLSEFGMSGRLSLDLLLKMFAKDETPIQSLEVDLAATDSASSLPSIKTLRNLRCICRSNIDENYLVKLVQSQTALETLQINNIRTAITIETIEKILKVGKNLKNFELSFYNFDVDLHSYNRILMLARDRVEVRLIVSNRREVDVPNDVLKVNRKWLRIMFD